MAYGERDSLWRDLFLAHFVAMAIYPAFIFGGFLGAGVVIAWVLDFADIFYNAYSIPSTLGMTMPAMIMKLQTMLVWGGTRLVLLPYLL